MKQLLAFLFILLIFGLNNQVAKAEGQESFEILMQEWNQKKELASQYLIEAEDAFKSGDELSGCVTQQKAGIYGIEATESLIKAMKSKGATDGLENLEAGLNKWKELRDFC